MKIKDKIAQIGLIKIFTILVICLMSFTMAFVMADKLIVDDTIKNLRNDTYQTNLRSSDSIEIKGDFTKSYNSSEKRLKIEDKDYNILIDMKLESDYIVSGLIASEDTKVAELRLINWKEGTELFDLVNYYNIKNDYSKISRTFRYKWENISEECFEGECFNITEWVEFNYLDELPHKNIKISLWTNTFVNENIEWVPTIQGFEVLEYASWDISSAVYTNNYTLESRFWGGLSFSADGTKFYVLDGVISNIKSFPLSTAWNVSTAGIYSHESVSEGGSYAKGFFFKPDGTELYISGANVDGVAQFTLSTAWNISTLSYTGIFNVSSETTTPLGVSFKPDGTKMYVAKSYVIYEYNLSTAWNVSTANFLQDSGSLPKQAITGGIYIKTDGLKLYYVSSNEDDINELTFSTAWNISTLSYTQGFDISSQDTTVTGLFFKPDGTKFYINGDGNNIIYQYSLIDETPPTYSSTAHNQTVANTLTLFSILYNDDTALDPRGQYIFSTNNTGTWTNESAVNFTATPSWANVTKTLNDTEGIAIGYRWYAFDNASNGNNTEIFVLTTTSSDSIAPNVTINSPLNQNYSTSEISFNVTSSDDTGVDSCWFSLDSGINNYTMINLTTTEWNYTNTSIPDGQYTANFYCNDTLGNLNNTENISFGIDTTPPLITINNPQTSVEENANPVIFQVTTNEPTSCIMELESTNYSMSTSDNLTHTYSKEFFSNQYFTSKFYCTDNQGYSNSTSITFYFNKLGSGGVTSGGTGTTIDSGTIVSTENVTIIGESNQTFTSINLEKLTILNEKLCIGETKLRFKTLDSENQFTLIDSAELYLNNTKSSNKLFLDVTNQEYYYILELEKGEIEVKLIVNQLGKQITETKSLNIERCITFRRFSENKLNDIINFIKENQVFFFYGFLFLIFLFLISYLKHKT